MRNVILSAVALTMIAAPAFAQSQPSTGIQTRGSIGYTHIDGADASLGAVTSRLGVDFNRYLGAEGEFSVGVVDDTFDIAGVEAKTKLEYDAAAYAVGKLPIGQNLELFGRVGYGTTQIETRIPGVVSASADGESLNYGAGANWFYNGRQGVRGEWTRRDFKDDGAGEVDTYGLSFVSRF